MNTNILDLIGKEFLFFDGGTGSVFQKQGLKPGEQPESWNISKPENVTQLHTHYFLSGANIIKTNTFGANRLKFGEKTDQIIKEGVKLAKKARQNVIESNPSEFQKKPLFIALDIGPSGKLLKPLGDLNFEDAVSIFKETAISGIKAGVDLVLIETMNDCYETKACVLGVKEAIESLLAAKEIGSSIPIFVTNVYDNQGRLLTGSTVKEMVTILEGLGVSALGMNCSLGPEQMEKFIPELVNEASIPVIINPNAGLPKIKDGKTVYDIDEKQFSKIMKRIASAGANILGGCCGTTPDYIKQLTNTILDAQNKEEVKFHHPSDKNFCAVCSATKTIKIGQSSLYGKNSPVLIGERINPTGKKKLKEALREKNISYILNEAISQEKNGAQILDVNVGLPEINETEMMTTAISEIQAVSSLPLQIDTSNTETMEKALRIYNGKALINSVNGKESVMNEIFPLVKKYGGVIVALTLDEDGIPTNSAGRIKIAEKIFSTAEKFGIHKKDILIDPLAMALSSDEKAPSTCLETVKHIFKNLNGNTILGVSNISFGLPKREIITSTFFAMALENGLSAAIMNPNSIDMQKVWFSFCALHDFDKNCLDYISFATTIEEHHQIAPQLCEQSSNLNNISAETSQSDSTIKNNIDEESLKYAIIKGLKDVASQKTDVLQKTIPSMQIVENEIIPALDIVGKQFEEKKLFLPQLLMSAEAASVAFDIIKKNIKKLDSNTSKKNVIVLATVQGDIHDIGKNIVKVILENYGYEIIDLGKDVSPQTIVDVCIKNNIKLVGLSALMTTTVPAMEKTIKLLKEKVTWCKICVGGAVLTEEYANKIGADFYSKDAMETVRFAKIIFA